MRAIRKTFELARDNPEEACKLHVQKIPEVALDDCMGSVRATLTFVYNDHTSSIGWGKDGAERLAFTWKAIADAQELKPDWDYKQAIDTSLVEK